VRKSLKSIIYIPMKNNFLFTKKNLSILKKYVEKMTLLWANGYLRDAFFDFLGPKV